MTCENRSSCSCKHRRSMWTVGDRQRRHIKKLKGRPLIPLLPEHTDFLFLAETFFGPRAWHVVAGGEHSENKCFCSPNHPKCDVPEDGYKGGIKVPTTLAPKSDMAPRLVRCCSSSSRSRAAVHFVWRPSPVEITTTSCTSFCGGCRRTASLQRWCQRPHCIVCWTDAE